MEDNRGFSLMEIIIVLVIIGISAVILIPNFLASAEQTKAQEAQNNLYAIAAAEQKYFEDYGSYCTTTTGHTVPCGDSSVDLNTNLHLSIADQFTYNCAVALADTPIPYHCTATDGKITVTLNPNAVSPTMPVSCSPVGSDCPF